MPIPYSGNPMGHTRERLPQGYRRVEYLESTGTQYINLGKFLINDYTMSAVFSVSGLYASAIFGCQNGLDKALSLYRGTGSEPISRFSNSDGYKFTQEAFQPYGSKILASINADRCVIGGVVKNTTTPKADRVRVFTPNYNFNIFRRGDGVGNGDGTKVYSFYTTDNAGAFVYNLVPALDPTGRPCMYDLAGTGTVEQNTYYNEAASGPDFLWG